MIAQFRTIPKARLQKLYVDEGWSLRAIAKKYGYDPGVVARALRYHQIPVTSPKKSLSLSKAKLWSLYVEKHLSTYAIAKYYGCDPKTVYKYLKLHHIPIRHKGHIKLTKSKLKRLYTKRGLSLSAIAKEYGYSAAGVLKKMVEYEIKRRSISETSTKHKKTDFDKDQTEKAYMIGFRLGDLGIRKRGNLIYVSSSTTKQVQWKLVKELFESYGPVWISGNGNRNVVNVSCALNNSFSFLVPKHAHIPSWICKTNTLFFAFLAGYTDAEGNICISNGRARFRLRSYDKDILRELHKGLARRGIPSLFGLDSKVGIDKRGAKHNKDCWFLIINQRESLFKLLSTLEPLLRHKKRKGDGQLALENVTRRLSYQGNHE